RASWAARSEFIAVAERLAANYKIVPSLQATHDMVADLVDECIHLLKPGFCNNFWGSSLPVPSYDRWWLDQSELPDYGRLVRLLQLIGADEPEKSWLLKNPGHVSQLDALLTVMPDACIIQTHRDPLAAVASLCSLIVQLSHVNAGLDMPPHQRGARE